MSVLLKMVKTNFKLLMRNIGFIICVLLIPIGAASILMIQQTGADTNETETQIVETEENASIMSASLSSMFDKVSVVVIDASQDEISELFLNSLSQENICGIYRYKTPELSKEEINKLAKSYYERGTVTAVVYIPADFGKMITEKGSPRVDVIKGRDDDRIELVNSIINQNISVMLQCALNAENDDAFTNTVKEAFNNMPEVISVIAGNDNEKLTVKQANNLSNIGYSIAVLSLAFILTGCFIANLIVSERDNKTLMRIEMSGSSMMIYIFAKAITAVFVSLIQAGITALTIILLIGTDIGIPFMSFIMFIAVIGVIFNLFCVIMAMFSKNILGVVYVSFGVWIFTNILSKVYFNFGTLPDWMDKLSMLTPQRWVMICSEMLMKNQSGVYLIFFTASAAFLILIITAGFIGARLQKTEK
ncbi:MAG: ABC transporter permease [Candidatus Pseudoruminococcus sp.]|nr:ABC transporter permease [Ruminococcus bromii]MDY2783635.1 ABC transporter permease [Candidatus Pseudoruminococcus sp.]